LKNFIHSKTDSLQSQKLVKGIKIKPIDEFRSEMLKKRLSNNKIPTRKSYKTINAVDIEDSYVSQKPAPIIDIQGAGNWRQLEKSPTRFKKNETSTNLGQRKSLLRRISERLMGKTKVAPSTIVTTTPNKNLSAASGSNDLTSQVTLISNIDKKNAAIINNFSILYLDFKQKKSRFAFYIVFEMCRNIVYAVILVFFQSYTYEQAIAICFLNTFMLLYLIIIRPFSKRKEAFLNTFNELMLNSCCYSCLYMAYLERIEDFDNEKILNAGWVIYIVNMLLIILFTLIFVVQILSTLRRVVPKIINLIRKRMELDRERKRIAALTKRTSTLKNEFKPVVSISKKEHFINIKKLVEGEEIQMFE
jgi:hypothetical protein